MDDKDHILDREDRGFEHQPCPLGETVLEQRLGAFDTVLGAWGNSHLRPGDTPEGFVPIQG